MSYRRFVASMWLQACDALDRAEGLQKQFFTLDRHARMPLWKPPVDLFETEQGLLVRAAIPDADSADFDVCLEGNCLRLAGRRAFPSLRQSYVIHRLEIPFGRIERVISLPPGRFDLEGVNYQMGCLEIRLTRIGPHV
jgi:HSP20 family protein